jgi:hypothetical protein
MFHSLNGSESWASNNAQDSERSPGRYPKERFVRLSSQRLYPVIDRPVAAAHLPAGRAPDGGGGKSVSAIDRL